MFVFARTSESLVFFSFWSDVAGIPCVRTHTLRRLSCVAFVAVPCKRVWPVLFVGMDGREHEDKNMLRAGPNGGKINKKNEAENEEQN